MTLGRAYRALAVFFAILAAVSGFLFLRMHWFRAADFDVTGLLWLLQNFPRLLVFLVFVSCVFTAIWYWVRSWADGRVNVLVFGASGMIGASLPRERRHVSAAH